MLHYLTIIYIYIYIYIYTNCEISVNKWRLVILLMMVWWYRHIHYQIQWITINMITLTHILLNWMSCIIPVAQTHILLN